MRDASGRTQTVLLANWKRELLDHVAEPVTLRGRLVRASGRLTLVRGINQAIRRILRVMATATFESVVPNLMPFRVPRAVRYLLGRVFGIDEITAVYETLQSIGSTAARSLTACSTSSASPTLTSAIDLARIPAGPARRS